MFRNKPWIEKLGWPVSRPRSIDEATMAGLLQYLEYQCARAAKLEDAGFSDNESVSDVLYDFVLDALGVPANESVHTTDPERVFSREWFYELFFHDYILEKEESGLTIEVVISTAKREAKSNLEVHYVAVGEN